MRAACSPCAMPQHRHPRKGGDPRTWLLPSAKCPSGELLSFAGPLRRRREWRSQPEGRAPQVRVKESNERKPGTLRRLGWLPWISRRLRSDPTLRKRIRVSEQVTAPIPLERVKALKKVLSLPTFFAPAKKVGRRRRNRFAPEGQVLSHTPRTRSSTPHHQRFARSKIAACLRRGDERKATSMGPRLRGDDGTGVAAPRSCLRNDDVRRAWFSRCGLRGKTP